MTLSISSSFCFVPYKDTFLDRELQDVSQPASDHTNDKFKHVYVGVMTRLYACVCSFSIKGRPNAAYMRGAVCTYEFVLYGDLPAQLCDRDWLSLNLGDSQRGFDLL